MSGKTRFQRRYAWRCASHRRRNDKWSVARLPSSSQFYGAWNHIGFHTFPQFLPSWCAYPLWTVINDLPKSKEKSGEKQSSDLRKSLPLDDSDAFPPSMRICPLRTLFPFKLLVIFHSRYRLKAISHHGHRTCKCCGCRDGSWRCRAISRAHRLCLQHVTSGTQLSK